MSIVNFGIIKAIVSDKFKDTIVENTNSSSDKKRINEFVEILKSSKLLETEFTIFSNLESKTITNENLAIKYIDENLSLLKKYSKNDLIAEHKKIEKFNSQNTPIIEHKNLYESIHTLIYETLDGESIANVDSIHESFSVILDHITKEKKITIQENTSPISLDGLDTDAVIEIAVKKFNEKFAGLTESEQKLLKTLTFSSEGEKNQLFESLKTNGLTKLNSLKSTTIYQDKINESIAKINNMKFNKETLLEDIISLNVLNSL